MMKGSKITANVIRYGRGNLATIKLLAQRFYGGHD